MALFFMFLGVNVAFSQERKNIYKFENQDSLRMVLPEPQVLEPDMYSLNQFHQMFEYGLEKSALEKKTASLRKSLTIPGILFVVGFWSGNRKNTHGFMGKRNVQKAIRKAYPDFRTHMDDYIQHLPLVVTYGLNACGVEGANSLWNRTQLLLKSEILAIGAARVIKTVSKNMRPSGVGSSSFPSGHTTQAFTAATFMHKEFGHKSIWYSIGAFGAASSVGACRILNNAHWVSDVLVGAALGVGSTNLVYMVYEKKKKKNRGTLVALPGYQDKAVTLSMNYTF